MLEHHLMIHSRKFQIQSQQQLVAVPMIRVSMI
jgi:hypothetical protein